MKRALIMAAGLWMIALHFYSPRANPPADALHGKHLSATAVIDPSGSVLVSHAELNDQR